MTENVTNTPTPIQREFPEVAALEHLVGAYLGDEVSNSIEDAVDHFVRLQGVEYVPMVIEQIDWALNCSGDPEYHRLAVEWAIESNPFRVHGDKLLKKIRRALRRHVRKWWWPFS